MNIEIRLMKASDADEIAAMMKVFYASAAVLSDGSEEIFRADIENCVNDNPYLEGYVFESAGNIVGYAMVAKSFSTEFGKRCIWIEDLYVKDEYRRSGIGRRFFEFITDKYEGSVFRLEAEEENKAAIALYEKCGFRALPYYEMKR